MGVERRGSPRRAQRPRRPPGGGRLSGPRRARANEQEQGLPPSAQASVLLVAPRHYPHTPLFVFFPSGKFVTLPPLAGFPEAGSVPAVLEIHVSKKRWNSFCDANTVSPNFSQALKPVSKSFDRSFFRFLSKPYRLAPHAIFLVSEDGQFYCSHKHPSKVFYYFFLCVNVVQFSCENFINGPQITQISCSGNSTFINVPLQNKPF